MEGLRLNMLVLENKGHKDFSIRKVGNDFNVHYSTLFRYMCKIKNFQAKNVAKIPSC